MTKKKNLVLIIVFSVAIILELIAGFNIRSKRLLKIKLYSPLYKGGLYLILLFIPSPLFCECIALAHSTTCPSFSN